MATAQKKTTTRTKPNTGVILVRNGDKKRGVLGSVGNTTIESADAVAETATAVRRSMEICNIMLKELKAEAIIDGYQSLMDRGYTYDQAVEFMEKM